MNQQKERPDKALVTAMHHEFLRCQDAFLNFAMLGSARDPQQIDRINSYRLYNSYSQFLHHLYEFYRGCVEREKRISRPSSSGQMDDILDREVQKALNNRRNAILKGYAPSWENDISAYPEEAPAGFGKAFREARNICYGHVSEQRPSVSLTEFFSRYHASIMLLYDQGRYLWSQRGPEFPDLGEITSFQIVVSEAADAMVHPTR